MSIKWRNIHAQSFCHSFSMKTDFLPKMDKIQQMLDKESVLRSALTIVWTKTITWWNDLHKGNTGNQRAHAKNTFDNPKHHRFCKFQNLDAFYTAMWPLIR